MIQEKAWIHLNQMYKSNIFEDQNGLIQIDEITRISPEQGVLLSEIASQPGVTRSLEIGFGYGFSTVFILEGLQDKRDSYHIAIDPFEDTTWESVGIRLTRSIGYRNFEWVKDHSIHYLSDQIQQEERFDFIYIDGNHRFDDILVDFYLSDQVLNVGGVLAMDDMWMKSSQLAAKFIAANRAYSYIKTPIENVALFRKDAEDGRTWDHFVDFC